MSDTAEYKLCEYINLEDNSIKEFRVLQRRGRAKLIPNTPRQPREPEEELLHLNSTVLRTKQERNLRESNLRCVFVWSPSPHIYRCAHGVLLPCNQLKLCRTDLGSQWGGHTSKRYGGGAGSGSDEPGGSHRPQFRLGD
jgi:hypothetical protein